MSTQTFMKSKSITTIICLSPDMLHVIESAVSLLHSARQQSFRFEVAGSMDLPTNPASEEPRPWSELEAALAAERQRRKCQLLIGVLNYPIENNWFSHAAYGKAVAWITAHDWEFYSDLPVVSFVAYDIVLNTVLMQLVTRPADEAWLMGEVIHINDSRGCISDMCAYKPDISKKITAGYICQDCTRILSTRLGPEALEAVSALLQTISRTAHPTKPATAIWDFPVLSRMQDNVKNYVADAHRQVEHEQSVLRSLESEQQDLELKLRKLNLQKQHEQNRITKSQATLSFLHQGFDEMTFACASETPPLPMDRPGLPERVESRYPFPIAYCFRSMRAELNPTDRWNTLFELYSLLIHYVVFALLSGLRHQQRACPEELKALVQKLKFGYAGDWGRACVALLKLWQQSRGDSFFKSFISSIDAQKLGIFEKGSKSVVQTRNSLEHGFKGDKQSCQRLFDLHLPDVKGMLQFIEPLADYLLIRPVQIVDNLDGQCVYFSKIMAGSDPQFLPRQMISSSVPETACQLLSPDGATLTLHPWLHLNRCDSCLREMVFVYDAIHIKDGKEAVLLREYPSNHEQRQPGLVPQVKKLLGV